MALTQALLMMFALGASPAPPPPGGDYIKVEIRGTLRSGMMAIGGETTGTVVSARGATWDLDLTQVPDGRKRAESLDGRPVLVKGSLDRGLLLAQVAPQAHNGAALVLGMFDLLAHWARAMAHAPQQRRRLHCGRAALCSLLTHV